MLIHILFRSMIAVPFICLILGLRAAVRRFPRKYVYAFWLLLLAELVFPFTIESRWGLLPAWLMETEVVSGDGGNGLVENVPWDQANVLWDGAWSKDTAGGTGLSAALKAPTADLGETEAPVKADAGAPELQSGEREAFGSLSWMRIGELTNIEKWYAILSLLWGIGASALLLLYLTKLYRIKKRVRFATILREPVKAPEKGSPRRTGKLWEVQGLDSAFILPCLPAKIYLPLGLEEKEREDILAHEYQHIRQLHPWIKLFSGMVLILHWFNPFVWIAVKCMTQDMEMICDEAVLQGRDLEERKRYAETLLKCAARKNGLDPCLAFGESNTQKRIRHLVQLKKARLILPMGLTAAALCCVPALFTVRAAETEKAEEQKEAETLAEKKEAEQGEDKQQEEDKREEDKREEDKEEEASILGYWGYTGYMDECINYTGYGEFADQDYDGDGRPDRVWRQETVQEDGSTLYLYRIEFGNGDVLTIDDLENDGIPSFQSGDLTGDGRREILFTQDYSYGTDPMGFGEMAVYAREETGYVRKELPFFRQDGFEYSEFVSLSYALSYEKALHVSCMEAVWEGTIEVSEELWDQAQYYRYDGEHLAQCIWNAQIQQEEVPSEEEGTKNGGEADRQDKLVCRIRIFDRWSTDELVITLGCQDGAFLIEEIAYEGDALIPQEAASLEEAAGYAMKDYREPQLHYYLPGLYEGVTYIEYGSEDEEYYEELARKALRELYRLTGTQLEECYFYYTNLESVHFGMTQQDLEKGRTFYDRYYNREGEQNIIESMWIASTRQVWYSPVDQYKLPSDYDTMTMAERAEWFLMQSGNYNGQAVASAYRPYADEGETWRLVMEDGTAYELRLNSAADSVTDITGPYPDGNIVH